MTPPDLETLLDWLDAGAAGDPQLNALAQALRGQADETEELRWARLRQRIDRPTPPEGLSGEVLDALFTELRRPSRPRRSWRRWAGLGVVVALAAGTLLVMRPGPEPVVLLAPSELRPAADPVTRGVPQAKAQAEGPALRVSATVEDDGLHLIISAVPGPDGVPVDAGSLRLRYGELDLTARLGPGGLPLDRRGLQVPAGRHRFTVSVRDLGGRSTTQVVEVQAP